MKKAFAGCCRPLPVIELSRHDRCNPCVGAWTHTLLCSSLTVPASSRWIPAHVTENTFGMGEYPCNTTSAGSVISRWQPFLHLQAPTVSRPPARTIAFSLAGGPRPFTPSISLMVTKTDIWHRYMPDMGNWHGWSLRSWIAALPAAPCSIQANP